MSKSDKYCENCKDVLGLRLLCGHPPEYIQGAVKAIVELYKHRLVKRRMSAPTVFADLMGLCMKAFKGQAHPNIVSGFLMDSMEPCGVYNCLVLRFKGELLCEDCAEEYHKDPDDFK